MWADLVDALALVIILKVISWIVQIEGHLGRSAHLCYFFPPMNPHQGASTLQNEQIPSRQ